MWTIYNEKNDVQQFTEKNYSEFISRNQIQKGLNTLKIVNDVAKRGVKLIQEYNNMLTKDEK